MAASKYYAQQQQYQLLDSTSWQSTISVFTAYDESTTSVDNAATGSVDGTATASADWAVDRTSTASTSVQY